MPTWFEHVYAACENAGVEPQFTFIADPNDAETLQVIAEHEGCRVVMDCGEHSEHRRWNTARYARMVTMRNALLEAVRQDAPDLFLSLDSDILLAPEAIASMLETMEQTGADAVGGKCYMTPKGTRAPSYMVFEGNAPKRPDTNERIPADVIMACKLMQPSAYAIDYQNHHLGEDIGWSLACAGRGLSLWWDGTTLNRHVMSPEALSLEL